MVEAHRRAKFPWHCSRAHERLRSADDHKLIIPNPAHTPTPHLVLGDTRAGRAVKLGHPQLRLCSLDLWAPGTPSDEIPFYSATIKVMPWGSNQLSPAGTGRGNNLLCSFPALHPAHPQSQGGVTPLPSSTRGWQSLCRAHPGFPHPTVPGKQPDPTAPCGASAAVLLLFTLSPHPASEKVLKLLLGPLLFLSPHTPTQSSLDMCFERG